MAYRLKFSGRAVREIGEAFDWYEEQSKGLPMRLLVDESIPVKRRCAVCKGMADQAGVPYQSLINLRLRWSTSGARRVGHAPAVGRDFTINDCADTFTAGAD